MEQKMTDYELAQIILSKANIRLAIDNAQNVIYAELAKLQHLCYDIARSNSADNEKKNDDVPVYDVLHVNNNGEVIGFEERVPDDDDEEDEEDED